MASKNKKAATSTANPTALRIGSRVRCTDDGVEGRIVWANAVSVKIKWEDGEQVTWKRDSLATRPIEILDPDEEARAVPAPRRQRKAPAAPKEKKVSALDAAARVLAEEGKPMSCQEMIGAMAAREYWSSPGGKTPSATLYSAILRELATKGDKARF